MCVCVCRRVCGEVCVSQVCVCVSKCVCVCVSKRVCVHVTSVCVCVCPSVCVCVCQPGPHCCLGQRIRSDPKEALVTGPKPQKSITNPHGLLVMSTVTSGDVSLVCNGGISITQTL